MKEKQHSVPLYFVRYQGMYWRPEGRGYTNDVFEAGLYTYDDIPDIAGLGEDRKSSRGDYAVEVGRHLRDLNFSNAVLDEVANRVELYRGYVNDD